MDLKTLADNFGILLDAPGGVDRLRELILMLAVRGKLLAQKPTDQPFDSSLGISIGFKGQKKTKSDLPLPFEVPTGWSWVSLGDISEYIQRGKSPSYVEASPVPVVSQKCVQWSGFDISRARYISEQTISSYGDERFLKEGDILWNSTGTGTIGRACVFPGEQCGFKRVVADSHVTIVRLRLGNPRYVYLWIRSPDVQSEIENVASGTTKQKELNTSTVRSYPIPLPPLEEQHRIVAKVDQLMQLCDELEQKQEKVSLTRDKLNAVSLEKLVAARNAEEFEESWGRVRENFELLYSDPENLKVLRRTILRLASNGRLATNDISGWKKFKFGDLIDLISGQHILADNYNSSGSGVPYLTGPSDFGEMFPIISKWTDKPKVFAKEGDILITVKGAGIGKLNILNIPEAAISRQLMAVRCVNISRDYAYLWLQSKFDHLQAAGVGIAIPGIGRADLMNLEITCPPIPEQNRIAQRAQEIIEQIKSLNAQTRILDTSRLKICTAFLKWALRNGDENSYASSPATVRATRDGVSEACNAG